MYMLQKHLLEQRNTRPTYKCTRGQQRILHRSSSSLVSFSFRRPRGRSFVLLRWIREGATPGALIIQRVVSLILAGREKRRKKGLINRVTRCNNYQVVTLNSEYFSNRLSLLKRILTIAIVELLVLLVSDCLVAQALPVQGRCTREGGPRAVLQLADHSLVALLVLHTRVA